MDGKPESNPIRLTALISIQCVVLSFVVNQGRTTDGEHPDRSNDPYRGC